MKSKNYLLINVILSSIGIYFSYFYFGEKRFFYTIYNYSDIIKSALYICFSIIFLYKIIDFFLERLSLKNLKKIFEATILGSIFYITYHFIIRFSDLSYYEIYRIFFTNKNFLFQIIFYFSPFLFGILIYLIISNENLKKINNFTFIVLIIFNILSFYRLTQVYLENSNHSFKNDYKTFKSENNKSVNLDKKVFFLIFDEFEQKYFKKHYDQLTNLKKIHQKSYSNNRFYTPANYTRESIPAILTGNSIQKTIIKNKSLSFLNLENEIIDFNFENSIFNDFKRRNLSSSIYAGYYIPYCRIFKIDICFDRINFKKENINLNDTFKIFLEVTFFEKILGKIFILNKKEIDPLSKNGLAKFMINNSENFINTNNNFIYIHYPFPHLPIQASSLHQNNIKIDNLSDYEKNLFLVDMTILNIQNSISKYKNSLLIITSDHWFRQPYLRATNQKKAYPVLFISKIIGDDQFFSNNESRNASSIKNLIIEYLDGNVRSNYDIKSFFDDEKNHKTYVRYFSG
jgi:hypothetical protein